MKTYKHSAKGDILTNKPPCIIKSIQKTTNALDKICLQINAMEMAVNHKIFIS
jgi:hypothetical protein